jgi:hypothetical protein
MASNGIPRRKWLGQPPELWLGGIVFVLSMTVVLPNAFLMNAPSGVRSAMGLLPLLALLLVGLGVFRIIRNRSYYRQPAELWVGAMAFLVLQASLLPLVSSSGASAGARVAIGLLPLLALLLVARGLVRIVREQDELYRRIRFEAAAYAAGAVILLSFVLGTLEQMQVIEPIGPTWAGFALILAWLIAAAVLNRRYR